MKIIYKDPQHIYFNISKGTLLGIKKNLNFKK